MQPSDLESAVKRQSWEWLFDLPPRLNVAIEVIDAELVPVFPPGSTRAAAALRRILTSREPSLVSAISNALRSETPAGAEADRLQVLCFRLSQGVFSSWRGSCPATVRPATPVRISSWSARG